MGNDRSWQRECFCSGAVTEQGERLVIWTGNRNTNGLTREKRPAWQELTEENREGRYFVGTKGLNISM
jgi:hypothetical protein